MNPNENLYDKLFTKHAAEHGLDWLLLKAQVKAESNFNPLAESPVGAKGLAQFMDKTWLEWEDETPGIQDQFRNCDPFNPEDSIRAQAAYMAWLKNRIVKIIGSTANSIEWTLAAYNWGIGKVFERLKLSTAYTVMQNTLPKETRDYVHKILKYYNEYKGIQNA